MLETGPAHRFYDRCKLCQSGRLQTVYFSKRNGFRILCCADCGLRFVARVFSKTEQEAVYQGESSVAYFVEAERAVPGAKDRSRELARVLMGHIDCETEQEPRLLDIGCGSGDFLVLARQEGFNVQGQEISIPAAKLAQKCHGLQIETGGIESYSPDKLYDAVTLLGVLEHVRDPKSLLSHAHRLLRPGGVLVIYTPVWGLYDRVSSLVARASGGYLGHLIDRRINIFHLQIFPRKTLVHVLARIGMTILASDEICEYNLPVDHYLESIGIRQASIQKGVARLVQTLIDRRLFFRNNMLIFARKTSLQ